VQRGGRGGAPAPARKGFAFEDVRPSWTPGISGIAVAVPEGGAYPTASRVCVEARRRGCIGGAGDTTEMNLPLTLRVPVELVKELELALEWEVVGRDSGEGAGVGRNGFDAVVRLAAATGAM
jgi:hypothetical protein